MLSELSLKRRRPGDKAKAEAVVDHGEATGCEVEPLAIDAGDILAFCCGMMRQSAFGGKLGADACEFALAKRV